MTKDIQYLKDLIRMCECSDQYREGPHWAVATVSRLREDLRKAEEFHEGLRRLRASTTA